MAELKEFKLPDIGEGLTEADILRWEVAEGDTVTVNQPLVEVETAKAAVELPSPYAGVIHKIHYDAGVTVDVGKPIVTILVGDPANGATGEAGRDAAGDQQPRRLSEDLVPQPPDPERQSVLVGYGVSEGRGRRRKRGLPTESSAHPTPTANLAYEVGATSVLAKPPVRKLAKSLGIDLQTVTPTGPNGTVSRADVEAIAGPAGSGQSAATVPAGGEQRIPISGVRKHTAAAMVASAFTAPHVTEFVTVDVSAMMELRDRVASRPEFRNVKVSPLLFVARAVMWAAARTPIINSTWDEPAGEIVVKRYVNLGIAAATERGLIVPNIKSAEQLSLLELAQAIAALTDTARSGKTSPADMSGGTITITNVGVFGIDTGTPILNPGEAAILAVGAIRRQPWVVGTGADERIEARWVTELAVSFDHRSVDGQQGSLFLADVAAVLNDPGLALL